MTERDKQGRQNINIKVNSEISSLFPEFSVWEYTELKQDISKHGIRTPLVVAQDGTLVDGHRRFKAWQELGFTSQLPVVVRKFSSKDEMIDTAITLNILRRHLNRGQRAFIAVKHILPLEKEKAKVRQGRRIENDVPPNLEEGGEAYFVVAKRIGISKNTLRYAEEVFKKGSPEIVKSVLDGGLSISKAYKKVKAQEKLLEKASQPLLESLRKGEVSVAKSLLISELPKEVQTAVARKVSQENPNDEQTELLVDMLLNKPEQTKEILSKLIVELTPPPHEIQEFVKKHGSDQPKFESGTCPICGTRYVANWVSLNINWEDVPDE